MNEGPECAQQTQSRDLSERYSAVCIYACPRRGEVCRSFRFLAKRQAPLSSIEKPDVVFSQSMQHKRKWPSSCLALRNDHDMHNLMKEATQK